MSRNNAFLAAIGGDCLQTVITVLGTDRPAQLTMSWMSLAFQGAGLSADVTAFPAALKAALEPTLKACLPLTATITLYTAKCVSRNDVRNASVTSAQAGTVAMSTSLPSNVAVIIQRGTFYKGQHGRGRLSMAYVPNTFITPATDPNLLNAAAVTAYTAFMVALFGTVAAPAVSVNGHSYYPAILSRPTPPSQVVTNAAFISPSFCILDTLLGTVRNRGRRRR
jgi:hypothetical protein